MIDEEIVVDKLRHVNGYTNDLKRMRGLSKDEYVADIVVQRAVERTFTNLIQSCIDLAQHIRTAEELSPTGTSKQEIEALGNAAIISADTEEKLKEAVGFRNILAHRYGDVNHDVVYEVLHNDLHWFEQFQQEIARWFQKNHQ
jgi:uncharacterized protein YutE (UPF0331/DUF86 family)